MKRKILLTSLLILTLTSCGRNTIDNGYSNFNISEWDTKLINKNITQLTTEEKSYHSLKKITFSNFNVDSTYKKSGLLRIYGNSQVGFYSLIKEDWIIEPVSSGVVYSYSLSSNSYVGYILTIINKINNDYFYSCYDAYGNMFYQNCKNESVINITQGTDGKVYCSYSVSGEKKVKVYNENRKLENSISDDLSGGKFLNYVDETQYFGYEIEKYNFSIYNSIVSVFDKNDKFKTSYSLPKGLSSSPGFFVGTDYIYQYSKALPDDAENYDVLKNNSSGSASKYSIESYKLDYITGQVEKIKLNYLLNSSEVGKPFKNEKGSYTYSLVYANLINSNKTLAGLEEYLVDSNGKIILTATEFKPTNFIKTSNGNYYNTSTGILYDEKLNVISHLKSISPTYVPSVGFIGSINGKYGIIDENGKIIIPFKYDSMDRDIRNNKLLVVKNEEVYSVDLQTKVEQYICNLSKYKNYGNGMYSINSSDIFEIISSSKVIYTSDYPLEYVTTITTIFSKYIIFNYTEYSNIEYYVTSLK